jgi:hypothetical protein
MVDGVAIEVTIETAFLAFFGENHSFLEGRNLLFLMRKFSPIKD